MGKSWLIASGKGGVGKSTLSACLSLGLAEHGHRVCVVDADIGLRDQDVILGLENRIVYDLMDVTNRRCRIDKALIQSEQHENMFLLPAAQFARCKEMKSSAFAIMMKQLKDRFDDVIVDCPAGIERGLRGLLEEPMDEVILVTTPDDVCIRNAERTAMVLTKKSQPRPRIIVNRLDAELIRAGEMYSARTVAETLDLELLGEVPEDQQVYRAMLTHHVAMQMDCPAAQAFDRIVRRMLDEEVPNANYGSEKLPWYKRMFSKGPKEMNMKEAGKN